MTYKDTFACMYCMNTVEAENYPVECLHCKVLSCLKCYTWLLPSMKMCYGCGEINPKKKAYFLRTSSFAFAYGTENWMRQNKSPSLPHKNIYSIALSVKSKKYYLCINNFEQVRELTEEEVKFING